MCSVSIGGCFPPSPVVTSQAETNSAKCVSVCVRDREREHGGRSSRQSQLPVRSLFFLPGLCVASGSAGWRVLCSPVPEESSQAEWHQPQPDTELQTDRNVQETRYCTGVVSVEETGSKVSLLEPKPHPNIRF